MNTQQDYWFLRNGKPARYTEPNPTSFEQLIPLPTPHTLSEPGITSIWLYHENREYVCQIETNTQERTYQILHWDVELEEGESPIIFEYKSMEKEPTMHVFLKWYFEVEHRTFGSFDKYGRIIPSVIDALDEIKSVIRYFKL